MNFLVNKFGYGNKKELVALILPLALFLLPILVQGASVDAMKQSLRQKMAAVQKEIDQFDTKIKKTQQQAQTLQRQIDLFNNQIGSLKLKIQQTELNIDDLEASIEDKDLDIAKTEKKLAEKRSLLIEYIQTIYQYDQENLLEIILKQENFSDFFELANSLQSIEEKIGEIFQVIKDVKKELEGQRQEMQNDLDGQNQLRNLQQIQKSSLENQDKSKRKLLADTQGQEQKYQKLVQKAQSDIAAIRNQLYSLENVGVSMTFEKALQYAQAAFNKTGVRPAFLLAILKNESSWGTKVGTGTWRKDMHTRDQGPFLKITQELGLNPDTTPVSKKPWYGWGGAMGPAQILPSVWMLLKDEVGRLTGHVPPNPWQIDDAFMGAAVKLARAGADAKTKEAEWKAAMIYFAGGNWSNPKYRFYGDNVIELADTLQGQINLIK